MLSQPGRFPCCVPPKTDKRMLGIVFMASEAAHQFTAGDLKLVTAVALQTAPAIEIALLHQLELEKRRAGSATCTLPGGFRPASCRKVCRFWKAGTLLLTGSQPGARGEPAAVQRWSARSPQPIWSNVRLSAP